MYRLLPLLFAPFAAFLFVMPAAAAPTETVTLTAEDIDCTNTDSDFCHSTADYHVKLLSKVMPKVSANDRREIRDRWLSRSSALFSSNCFNYLAKEQYDWARIRYWYHLYLYSTENDPFSTFFVTLHMTLGGFSSLLPDYGIPNVEATEADVEFKRRSDGRFVMHYRRNCRGSHAIVDVEKWFQGDYSGDYFFVGPSGPQRDLLELDEETLSYLELIGAVEGF